MGCVRSRSANDPWSFYRKLGSKLEARSAGEGSLFGRSRPPSGYRPKKRKGWAIELKQFDEPSAAKDFRRRLADEAGVKDAWVRKTREGAAVLRGRFQRPKSDRARAVLRQTRMIRLGGKRPFKHAEFVPLGPGAHGAAGKLDLRRFSGKYSLQIGFYNAACEGDRRERAEERVRALREKGHEAYYYHGPNRSLVTIGVFTRSALRKKRGAYTYGPRIRKLQKKFPHHRINGEPVVLQKGGPNQKRVLQPSFVVKVR